MLLTGPWPVGILGLVAGRLADETSRPAVVGTVIATPDGDVVRASCRSDGRLSLAVILDACSDLLLRHGGHAAAAGFELPAERWDAFTARFLVGGRVRGARRSPEAAQRRPGAAGLVRGLRPVPRPRAPRAMRDRQPGAARGRARPDRPARPGRQRRPHPARAASRPRRPRRDRVRPRRTSPTTVVEGDRVDVVARLASRTLRRPRDAPAGGPRRLGVRRPPARGRGPRARRGERGRHARPASRCPCPSAEEPHDETAQRECPPEPPGARPRSRTACSRAASRSRRSSRSSACSSSGS